MAAHGGTHILHVDVDRTTMQMNEEQLARCLELYGDGQTALLIDHPFGYPAANVAFWRRLHPDVLIIEDCVRALGSTVDGAPVGSDGDWVLFSMYKTTVGNQDGAVLVSRTALELGAGAIAPVTLRQWAAGVTVLRWVHDWMKRSGASLRDAPRDRDAPAWSPLEGSPNRLCWRRFNRQVEHLQQDRIARRAAGAEIQQALENIPDIRFMKTAPQAETSAFFLSFTFRERERRRRVVERLHRQGLYLVWAWNVVPAVYRSFAQTFPYGCDGSVFLADHVCHVPLEYYLPPRRRARLIAELGRALVATA